MKVDFYFDVVCPFAFLASRRLPALVGGRAELRWRPTLLGGIYRETAAPQGAGGSATDAMSPAKKAVNAAEFLRTTKQQGVVLHESARMGATLKTLTAMRVLCAAEDASVPALAAAIFSAHWEHGRDITQPTVLISILSGVVGETAAQSLLEAASQPAAKATLRANTDAAVAAGAFGVPTMVISGAQPSHPLAKAAGSADGTLTIYGQDRLHFVDALLSPHDASDGRAPWDDGTGTLEYSARGRVLPDASIDLFHDFSSPWSYLAATQAERVASSLGVALNWRPMLLGALFKEIGTPNVPLFTMPESKQRMMKTDMQMWARWWGEPLHWPTSFPIRSVLALRCALAAPQCTLDVYRAAWVEGVDVADASALATSLTAKGHDAEAILAAAQSQPIKDALRRNTADAVAAGACGAPTFIARDGAGGNELVWGQDRWGTVVDEITVCRGHVESVHSARAQ